MNSMILLGILGINLCWVGILLDYSYYHMRTLDTLEAAVRQEYLFEAGRIYAQAYYGLFRNGVIQAISRKPMPIEGVRVLVRTEGTQLVAEVTVGGQSKKYAITTTVS